MAAKGLVNVFFPEFYESVAFCEPVGTQGRVTAADTYCMDFVYMLCHSHKGRHRTERLSEVVHVKPCCYYADTLGCKDVAYVHDSFVKKLGFVYTDYIDL